MYRTLPAALLITLAGCSAPPPPAKVAPAADGVSFTPVKWPQLEQAIAAHRGSVVVIDVWAEY